MITYTTPTIFMENFSSRSVSKTSSLKKWIRIGAMRFRSYSQIVDHQHKLYMMNLWKEFGKQQEKDHVAKRILFQ